MEQLVYSPQSLGKALLRQRKVLKLNQNQAGMPFNLTQSMVSKIEHGFPGIQIDTLFRMLAALDLEMVIRSKDLKTLGKKSNPKNDHKNNKEEW